MHEWAQGARCLSTVVPAQAGLCRGQAEKSYRKALLPKILFQLNGKPCFTPWQLEDKSFCCAPLEIRETPHRGAAAEAFRTLASKRNRVLLATPQEAGAPTSKFWFLLIKENP